MEEMKVNEQTEMNEEIVEIKVTESEKTDFIINSVNNFVKAIGLVESDWNEVYDEIGRCHCEISDVLHEIELTDFNHVEGYQLSDEVKKISLRRRTLKDYQEICKTLVDFIDRNKGLKVSLAKVGANMERTKKFHAERFYTPRVRTDLKLSNMTSNKCTKENEESCIADYGDVMDSYGLADSFSSTSENENITA